MLMTPNNNPTHIIGAAEGLAQKFVYYAQNEQVKLRATTWNTHLFEELLAVYKNLSSAMSALANDEMRPRTQALIPRTYMKPCRKH